MNESLLQSHYDVVVVGYGPAGAVAALSLGRAGVRTLVIDKSESIWQIPRAIAIDHEVLRALQNLGAAEDVLPFTAPFPASEHFGADNALIRRIHMVDPPYPLGYTPNMVFTQPAVEAVLRAHVSAQASVTVELGCELHGFTQDDSHASLQLVRKDGTAFRVNARYVLGCDGASSTVRRLAGLKLDDLGFDEPWLVVDVHVHPSGLQKLPVTAAQYCNPVRPTTFIVGPGNHRRWEIMLSPGEDAREMEQPDNVWQLLSPWLTPADGELWRASSYRFHALLAPEWRLGRVFLAGDAAHQQPPFIGQGMCQGVRDVTNLCWKLVEVLNGNAPPALLDSYQAERREHVHTLTSRIKAIGHGICERDPAAAQARDAALREQGGGQAPTVTRQEIVPPLTTGLLANTAHEANGTLFPQPWLLRRGKEERMDAVAGHGWRVVLDGTPGGPEPDSIPPDALGYIPITTIVLGGAGLQERDGVAAAWFKRNNAQAAVVRPDHYIYGVARSLPELTALLSQLRRTIFTAEAAGTV